MSLWPQTAWFPMLRKELVERAARRRTYVVRLLYAFAFFGAFLLVYQRMFESGYRYYGAMGRGLGGGGLQALGRGDEIFIAVLVIQIFGIFLFLPAMMCGLITDEKERGTLPLLLLTDISAPEAILQKYFGGLIPMVTLLMLTLPVGGFAYLIGGLTTGMVLYGALVLLILSATVAAIGLACSSYGRTTVGAFMGTYFVLGVLYFLPTKALYPRQLSSILTDTEFLMPFVKTNAMVTVVALVVACLCYQRRANVSPKFYLRRLFQGLDRRFKSVNERVGGFELIKDGGNLPKDKAILWRERQRRQLGKARYQIRYIVVFTGMAVLIALVDLGKTGVISMFAWGIGSIIIVAQASNSVVSDRLTQSLEVLLTTPLTGAEIVREKARALLPLVLVVALPIWTLSFFGGFADWMQGYWDSDVWPRVIHETVHLFVFLNLFLVLGLAVGLGARTRITAMMKAIGILVFWCVLPVLVVWFAETSRVIDSDDYMAYFGPSGVILGHFAESDFHADQFGVYLLAMVIYIGIGLGIYSWCLRNADRKLGRPA